MNARSTRRSCVVALVLGLAAGHLRAQTGGQVVAGAASFSTTAGALTITQTSDRAIINWQDFSIARGGLARFVQPDATSATLNRVISGLPSSLAGSLEANGRVFLINPNGILVGAGARIDTAGFLASTLDVTNDAFLAGGDLHFTGGSNAAIQNLGAINALGGDVFLIARQVENSGTVTAANGTTELAAGSEILLTTGGDERLFVQAASAGGTVLNAGTITAATAELKAAGGNAYALAINNSGLVRATGTAVRDGQLWLVADGGALAISGTLDVSSATGSGGHLRVRGAQVTIDPGAHLAANGATGGGEIYVLGDARVLVGGTLEARGSGGAGGFIETSAAHVEVTDGARVSTAAPNGRSGTWLIDPVDFTIAASGGDMTGAAVGAALAGGNFTIQSTAGSAGTAGDVNVNDPISWSANRLTLNAQNNINFNAILNGSGAASLALEYGQGAVAAGNLSDYSVRFAVNLPAGNTFSTKLGSDGAVKNYTVITSVGVAGDTSTTTLQGMKNSLSGLFALGADIDAMGTSSWNAGAGFAPVGTNGFAFNGSFAGLGHTICDLTINRPATDYIGLFGYISSSVRVRDVGIIGDSSVTGHFYVGGLVGYISGGTVSNSYATDGTTAGSEAVGGLVGRNYDGGTISNSYATGSVSSISGYAGGLVADNNGTVIDSFATGNVSGNNNIGGLAGGGGGPITNSYATGDVSGPSVDIGGLVGGYGFGTITNSYATGSVNGGATAEHVGGLVGYVVLGEIVNSYATGAVTGNQNVGGLVGSNNNTTITTSYSTGHVTGTGSSVGGLVGDNQGTVTDSFWNSEANGSTPGFGGGDLTGATGLTTAQMRSAASFAGFTFTTTTGAAGNNWVIVDADGTLNNAGAAAGATYPMLASEYSTTIRGGHQLQLVQMTPAASYTLGKPLLVSATGDGTDVWGSGGFVPLVTFTGTLDGLGRTISDLTINRPTVDNVGLFGTGQGSAISNLGLLNPIVTGQQQVGALVGLSTGVTVNTSYVIGGAVTGTTNVGGMIGQGSFGGIHPPHPTSITDSYTSNVNVTGTTNVGGLVGFNSVGSITNAYASSAVTGTSNVGGLVGSNLGNPGTITNSFWNKTMNATGIGSDALPGDTPGATGMTAAELQQQANFTSATSANGNIDPAWNFANTWVMYDGFTAPLLRVFMKPLRVQAGDAAKTYDGLAYSGGTSITYFDCPDLSLLFGTVGYGGSSQGAVNVGSYAITPQGLYSNQQGYIITFAPGTLTVNKANLTLSGSRVYDGTAAFAGSNLTATGVHAETFTLTGSGAAGNLSTKDVQSGALNSVAGLTLGIGNTGAAIASNYNALSVTGSSVSVTPANLTLTGTRVYDGTKIFAGGNLTAAGVNGETFTVTGAGDTTNLLIKNVQSNSALNSVTGLSLGSGNTGAALASNYNALSVSNSSVGVTPATLTIAGFLSDNKVYDGNANAVIATPGTLTGVMPGDTVGFTQTGATFDTQNVGTSKTVTLNGVTLTGSGDEVNYTYTATTTDLSDITVNTLTYTADPANRLYGAADPAFSGTITGFVPSETQLNATTGTLTFTTTATVTTNVGTYAINGSGLTANNGNYVFAQAAANATALTINRANLVLTGTRVYNGTTTFAATDLGSVATGVNGQTFALTGNATLGSKNVQSGQPLASTAGLTLGAGNSGAALASNYNALADATSSVSVTKAALTLSALDVVKTYDGGTTATGTAVVTAGTLFSGDVLASGPFGPGFAFVGKNVGIGNKIVTLTGIGVNDGNAGNNYTVTLADNTTSTINPANLTLAGTRVYNGATNFAGENLTATGVNGETFTVTGTGDLSNLSTRNVQTAQLLATVTGLGVGTGNTGAAIASNYNALATTGSSVSVTPASLTVSATDAVKVYDGGTTATSYATLLAGSLSEGDYLDGGTFAYVNKDVGFGDKTVTVADVAVNDGNGGNNYAVTLVDNTTSTIDPADLIVSGTRVYDGTTDFAGTLLTATGVNGETFAVTGNGVLGSRDVQDNEALADLSGLVLGAGNSGAAVAGNYNAVDAAGSEVSVTPASLTVSTDDVTKTYDGNTTAAGSPVVTLGTLFSGDLLAGGTFAFVGKDVGLGNKTVTVADITVDDGNNGDNYTLTLADNTTSTINAAALTLAGTRVYDGTTVFAGANLTATGVNGETFTVTGGGASGNLSTRNVQTGQALASVGGLALGTGNSGAAVASNYNDLATAGSSVSVTPASLTASTLDVIKTYDGGTTALGTPVVTVGTLFGGDALAGGSFAFVGKDVGLGNKTVTVAGITVSDGNAGSNYTVTQANNTTSTINRANLTLSGTRVFDGTTVFAGSNLAATGVNGESFGVTGAGAAGNLGSRNVQTNQLLASVSGLGVGTGNSGAALASNYNALATAGSTVSVTPAPLTITADDKSKIYGAANPALTATYAGLVPSDDASVVSGLTLNAPTGASATAGAHAIAAGGATASNYTIALADGTLTVTPAPVTVNADAKTKIYGNADPALTFAAGPLQYADTVAGVFTGALTRVAGETVAASPYQIGLGSLAANANYTVVYTGNELTITPRPITLVATATTKIYGAVDPALGVTLTAGTLGSVTVSDTLADVTGTLDRQAGQNVGLYDVQLGTGARATNYAITFNADNDAFAITPAVLTYVANTATRPVDTANPAFSGTVTGFAFSETLATATTGTPVFDTTATMASPVGTYAINGSGLTANFGNYTFVQAPPNATAFTITPLAPPPANVPLTITADNKTKTYGAALPAFTATFAGFVNGDTAASVTGLQFSTTATMGSNVGTYTITPFGAMAPSTYVVGYVPGTLTISRAPLTITANNISRLFGETVPPFTASFTGLVNGDTPAVVTGLTFSTAPTSAPDAFTIMPLSAVAANYSLLYVNGTLQVVMPTVTVGADELPVVLVNGEPAFSPEFAVVEQDGHLVLVETGDEEDNSYPPGEELVFTLTEATDMRAFENSAGVTSLTFDRVPGFNLGGFELVASLPGGSSGRSDTNLVPEPGLFRESSLNMGGFNVIYHEAFTDVHEQTKANTALGSSYREFSDSDNPQVNLVRTKVERKPGETSAGPNGSGSL